MSRVDQLRKLANKWNEAWNSHDPAQLAEFFAEGATYYEPHLDGPVDGKAGIGEIARSTWADWPEASFEAVSITIEDPRVVVEWKSSAKHKSGVVLQLEGVDVLAWEGDNIKSAHVYYDVHKRKIALG